MLLKRAGLPVSIQLTAKSRERILKAMQLDKKASDGEVKFVLARRIGSVEHGCKVPTDLVAECLGE